MPSQPLRLYQGEEEEEEEEAEEEEEEEKTLTLHPRQPITSSQQERILSNWSQQRSCGWKGK